MKALVIGGAGFIGSHIVDELLRKGYRVIVIDNLSTGNKMWLPNDVIFYKANILEEELETIFSQEKPDYVFHMAAQVSVANSMADPQEDASQNVLGTINVLKLSAKYSVKKIVFSSSAAVYGDPKELPVSEEHVLNPTSYYGMSKASAEEYIRLFSKFNDLKHYIFRFSNVYGPRQNDQGEAGVIANFTNRAMNNETLVINGDGEQTRDFIFVKDIARACVHSLKLNGSATFNLSSNNQTSINDIVKLIKLVTDKDIDVIKTDPREGDIRHSCISNEKAIYQMGWEPKTPLSLGLFETYQQLMNMRQTV